MPPPLIVVHIHHYLETSDLVARGVLNEADLVRGKATERGKIGCTVNLEYEFVPPGAPYPAGGYTRVGSSRSNPHPAYANVIDIRNVPILYDPCDPTRSMLFSRTRACGTQHAGYMAELTVPKNGHVAEMNKRLNLVREEVGVKLCKSIADAGPGRKPIMRNDLGACHAAFTIASYDAPERQMGAW